MSTNSRYEEKQASGSRLDRFVDAVEHVGNKIPHPTILFLILSILVVVISAVCASMGMSVQHTVYENGVLVETTTTVKNLLSAETLIYYMTNWVTLIASFTPVGIGIFACACIGVADKTGMFEAVMRKFLSRVPISMIIIMFAFVGVNSSICASGGAFFTILLGVTVFKALGYHPWVGIFCGFASAAGGYTACILPSACDAIMAGVSTQAIQSSGIADSMGVVPVVHTLSNYYFVFVSAFLCSVACWFAATKFTIPKLAKRYPGWVGTECEHALDTVKLTAEEERGVRWAGISCVIYIGAIVLACIPSNSIFRNSEGGFVPSSPLLDSVVVIFCLWIVVTGSAYGFGSGKLKSINEIPTLMQESLTLAAPTILVAFTACIFTSLFNQSNLATILAVDGANFCAEIGLGDLPFMLIIILFVTFLNLIMTSNSGKWMVLAPLFIPMFSMLGIHPAVAQLVYRVGDAAGNCLSPVAFELPFVLGLVEQYKVREEEKIGMGTVLTYEFPYFLAIEVIYIIDFIVFYLLKLPLGPGVPWDFM